jgi:hypothetical protein
MSAVRIIRGTATLPLDLEDQFFRAYGRGMTREEREFFGLTARTVEVNPAEHQKLSEAA